MINGPAYKKDSKSDWRALKIRQCGVHLDSFSFLDKETEEVIFSANIVPSDNGKWHPTMDALEKAATDAVFDVALSWDGLWGFQVLVGREALRLSQEVCYGA